MALISIEKFYDLHSKLVRSILIVVRIESHVVNELLTPQEKFILPPLQILENLQRGFREVEGVEVDAFDFVVQQLLHLAGGPFDADFGDLLVIRCFQHLAEQLRRDS